MRLYTTSDDVTSVQHDDHGTYDVDADGAVEVPHEFGQILHNIHIGGKQLWETEAERFARLEAEMLAHRQDPATLLAAVERLGGFEKQAQATVTVTTHGDPEPEPEVAAEVAPAVEPAPVVEPKAAPEPEVAAAAEETYSEGPVTVSKKPKTTS